MTIVRQFVPSCGAERAFDLDRLKAAMAQPIGPIFATSIQDMESTRAAIKESGFERLRRKVGEE